MAIAAVAGMGLGATALGGAVGAAGSIFGGFANSSMYQYQAGLAQMNAQVARQNAAYEVGLGETQAQEQALKDRQKTGQIKAQLGASGLAYGAGTSKDVIGSQAEVSAFNEEIITGNALKRAYNFDVQALQDDYQAKADQAAASNSMIAGGIGAFTSILGAGGSFSSKWLQAQQMGISPSFNFFG